MNKDVIYVEPENDITDIITKIENSPEKIVVLVPPKKAGVFRSVVNIKLIARAANNSEKTVVLVTVDPSIIKLAAASRIPVTKDLKTPPTVPEIEESEASAAETEIIDDIDEDEIEEPDGTKLTHRHEEKVLADKEAEEHQEKVAAEEIPEEAEDENAEDKNGCKETHNAPLKKLLQDVIQAIRTVDKKHLIIIEGNCWGNNYAGVLPLFEPAAYMARWNGCGAGTYLAWQGFRIKQRPENPVNN